MYNSNVGVKGERQNDTSIKENMETEAGIPVASDSPGICDGRRGNESSGAGRRERYGSADRRDESPFSGCGSGAVHSGTVGRKDDDL